MLKFKATWSKLQVERKVMELIKSQHPTINKKYLKEYHCDLLLIIQGDIKEKHGRIKEKKRPLSQKK